MADPITIPLAPHQQALFAGWDRQEVAIKAQRNAAATALIAGVVDPAAVKDWGLAMQPDAIVLTPPE